MKIGLIRFFFLLFDRVPVQVLTSDLHHRTQRKNPTWSEIMILECSFSISPETGRLWHMCRLNSLLLLFFTSTWQSLWQNTVNVSFFCAFVKKMSLSSSINAISLARMAMISWWDGPLAVVFSLCCQMYRLSCLPFVQHFLFIMSHIHAHTHTHTHTHECVGTRVHVWVSVRAWCQFFLLFILFLCMCVCVSVRACHGGYIEMFNFLAGISEYSTVSVFSVLLLFFTLCTGPGTRCHP